MMYKALCSCMLAATFLFPTLSHAQTPKQWYEKHARTCVRVQIASDESASRPLFGSGFIVNSQPGVSYILTSYHLVAQAAAKKAEVFVSYLDDNWNLIKVSSSLLEWDEANDLALLQTNKGPLPIVKFGDSAQLEFYTDLVILSFPWEEYPTATFGKLSSRQGRGGKYTASVPAYHGSSGGPVFHAASGYVVGIVSSGLEGIENVTFAIPSRVATKLVARFPEVTFHSILQETAKVALRLDNIRPFNDGSLGKTFWEFKVYIADREVMAVPGRNYNDTLADYESGIETTVDIPVDKPLVLIVKGNRYARTPTIEAALRSDDFFQRGVALLYNHTTTLNIQETGEFAFFFTVTVYRQTGFGEAVR